MPSAEQELISQFVSQLSKQYDLLVCDARSAAEDLEAADRSGSESTRMIAPLSGTEFPADADFESVICKELSSTAIAFWRNELPRQEYFAVRFDVDGRTRLVKAKVVHTTREFDWSKPSYLIGCTLEGPIG